MPKRDQTTTDLLTSYLDANLLTVLLASGFKRCPLSPTDAASRELRSAFPFGYLKRVSGENLDLMEIQLDKSGRAAFVLNIGVAPPQGVSLPWGHFAQEDVVVSALPDAFRVFRRSGSRQWFGAQWFPLDPVRRIAQSVTEAKAVLAEIEKWFETKIPGKHMREVGLMVPRDSDSRAPSEK